MKIGSSPPKWNKNCPGGVFIIAFRLKGGRFMKIAASNLHMARLKISHFAFYILPFALFLSGCASFRVAGQLQPRRYALMRGDPKVALAHFQRAAELDP